MVKRSVNLILIETRVLVHLFRQIYNVSQSTPDSDFCLQIICIIYVVIISFPLHILNMINELSFERTLNELLTKYTNFMLKNV